MEEDRMMRLLPEEILIDIASRLSAKDACRLKCSSKAWLFLISFNSDFRKSHRRRAPQRPPLLVLANRNRLPQRSVDDFRPPKLNCNFHHLLFLDCRLQVESCRDLMCFSSLVDTYVYSPLTMEYLSVYTYNKNCTDFRDKNFKVGLVYIDSLRLYKLVKLDLYSDKSSGTARAKFESVTLAVDDEDGSIGRVNDDENYQTPWEWICEHTVPLQLDIFKAGFGNLIGVNGVVYSIVTAIGQYETKVVSLSFDEDKEQEFKIFNLPQVGGDISWGLTLSRVKDVLCFPHLSDSTIDLWMLEDGNTGLWSKGYTICYVPPGYGSVDQVVYLPHPTTIDDDDNDGLFLFAYGLELYQYDIRTKEAGKLLLPGNFYGSLHVYHDNLVSLKDAARCTLIPKLSHDLDSPELEEKTNTSTSSYSAPPLTLFCFSSSN